MIARYPDLDQRRARDLFSELETLASVLLPEWKGAKIDGDFGRAVLQLSARMAERVTARIRRTPERDVFAFFDMLDVPVESARAARAPLVFVLTDKAERAVHAPAGIQVGASTDGDEVIFETLTDVKLTPARLAFLAAADGDADTIELAPRGFLDLTPPAGALPSFQVASFAEKGSITLQIDPAEGLEEGDLVRIGGVAYRLGKPQGGIFFLLDPLEHDVHPEASVKKVTQFDAFHLRNIQQHVVYIGHASLLKIDAPASIVVDLKPPEGKTQSIAARLNENGVVWEIYGKPAPDSDEKKWIALEAEVGADGEITLHKSWVGSVEEEEVFGQNSRWLRARHPGAIRDAALADTRTQSITLRVSSGATEAKPPKRSSCCGCGEVMPQPEPTVVPAEPCAAVDPDTVVEGSATITQAFHNTEPLPLTSRFLPFGPEPQRFDAFAVAAPEALTKPGATVTLAIDIPEATIVAMDAVPNSQRPRVYGVGKNGHLQAITVIQGTPVWQDLGCPQPVDAASAGSFESKELVLDKTLTPQALQVAELPQEGDDETTDDMPLDVVVARDLGGRLWAREVAFHSDRFEPRAWHLLPALKAQARDVAWLILNPVHSRAYAAALLTIGVIEVEPPPDVEPEPSLLVCIISSLGAGIQSNVWQIVATTTDPPPLLGSKSRLSPVLGLPRGNSGDDVNGSVQLPQIVALDENGAPWAGNLVDSDVLWASLTTTDSPRASLLVRPAASAADDDRLFVFLAEAAQRKVFAINADADAANISLVTEESDFVAAPCTEIRCLPSEDDGDPLAMAVGSKNGRHAIAIWQNTGEDATPFAPLADEPAGVLISDAREESRLIVNGPKETLNVIDDVSEARDSSSQPTWRSAHFDRGYHSPELAWEYFDGRSWRRIEKGFSDTTNNLTASGAVTFEVPDDIAKGEVAGQEDYWVRARLIGGDYGRPEQKLVAADDGNGNTTQIVVIDTSKLVPPEVLRIEAYFDVSAGVEAEHVVVENNLGALDQTQASHVDGASFELFEGVKHVNGDGAQRVLYFGFNKYLEAGSLSLWVDAEEQDEELDLQFEVLAGGKWVKASARDGTRGLQARGFVLLDLPSGSSRARLFGAERHWLRARPGPRAEKAAAWAPRLRAVFVNAVRAAHAQTITQESLGTSIGEPNVRLTLAHTPVIADSLELRVREELSEEEREQLGSPVVKQFSDISLEGDWVLWKHVDSFADAHPDDRVFQLDPDSGSILFGDGTNGRVPPPIRGATDTIRAIEYQSGGGKVGNVGAFQIVALKSAIEGVESVANPVEAAGGSDAPAPETQLATAPARLRAAGQALTAADFESVAVASAANVVRARCISPDEAGAPIRVAIAMRTGERCPKPPRAVREELAAALRTRAWGGLANGDVEIIPPHYVHASVHVTLRAKEPERAAELEEAAKKELRKLLDPIDGGPNGRGWPFGRRIWESDVLRALAALPALDTVESIRLEPASADESFDDIPALGLMCAEEDRISVTVPPDGREV